VFELGAEHEQVVFCNDPASGLKAIIAIHSTALGPGLGGTRFYPYASTADAVRDVLNLSRGMSYKNALAGLDLGGGKAVIIGDPTRDKTETLLRAYGRFVQSLNGRYITACDVGTYCSDMDVIAGECDFVTGRTSPTRRRRLARCSRRTASSRACARPPRPPGARRALEADGRRRRGRQGRPPPGRPPVEDGARSWSPT
jgi:glutamate dehydrogenase/leucine dehydrogenase